MNKDDLLKIIAQSGYNIGFGAKKHFATYDIISKVPGGISFVTMAIGIYALVFDALNVKGIAATMSIFGIIALYINFYDDKKNQYEKAGVELTQLFNALKDLYFEVKNLPDDSDLLSYKERHSRLEAKSYELSISKQILASNWYAHYKFFWEHQIQWIDDQLHFKFWRDKLPLSFIMMVIIPLILLSGYFLVCIVINYKEIWPFICNLCNLY